VGLVYDPRGLPGVTTARPGWLGCYIVEEAQDAPMNGILIANILW
jgi:hypothetical protein